MLRDEALKQMQADPYAKPYFPTTEAARKLSSRLGPADALDELDRRAAKALREAREQKDRSTASLARLASRRNRADRDVARQLEGMTPGQRLDRAITLAAKTSGIAAARIDGDVVHGGGSTATPLESKSADPAAPIRRIANKAVADAEDQLEHMLRRHLGNALDAEHAAVVDDDEAREAA